MSRSTASSSDDEVMTFTTMGANTTLLRIAAGQAADVLEKSLNASGSGASTALQNPQQARDSHSAVGHGRETIAGSGKWSGHTSAVFSPVSRLAAGSSSAAQPAASSGFPRVSPGRLPSQGLTLRPVIAGNASGGSHQPLQSQPPSPVLVEPPYAPPLGVTLDVSDGELFAPPSPKKDPPLESAPPHGDATRSDSLPSPTDTLFAYLRGVSGRGSACRAAASVAAVTAAAAAGAVSWGPCIHTSIKHAHEGLRSRCRGVFTPSRGVRGGCRQALKHPPQGRAAASPPPPVPPCH